MNIFLNNVELEIYIEREENCVLKNDVDDDTVYIFNCIWISVKNVNLF